MKKKKLEKTKEEKIKSILVSKQLQLEEDYFMSYMGDEPSFVDKLNKASDPYIEASKKI